MGYRRSKDIPRTSEPNPENLYFKTPSERLGRSPVLCDAQFGRRDEGADAIPGVGGRGICIWSITEKFPDTLFQLRRQVVRLLFKITGEAFRFMASQNAFQGVFWVRRFEGFSFACGFEAWCFVSLAFGACEVPGFPSGS